MEYTSCYLPDHFQKGKMYFSHTRSITFKAGESTVDLVPADGKGNGIEI